MTYSLHTLTDGPPPPSPRTGVARFAQETGLLLGAMAEIDQQTASAYASADAVRLQAIQRELIGALHAASDSEVMKAAATNMNLVALLGGKSPAELLAQVVRGTPLARSSDSMRDRAKPEK